MALQLLLLTISDWVTRAHQRVTEYLLAENAMLREQLRGSLRRYTDATNGKKLERRALKQLDTWATPDTLMRWYRRLVAKNMTGPWGRGSSRPRDSDVDVVKTRIYGAGAKRPSGFSNSQV